MPTSVHIPAHLLAALDKRAASLGVSRNSLIVRAVERDLGVASEWPAGFFEWLTDVDDDERAAVSELLAEVKKQRSSKGPPRL